jgi:flagellar export protein FliJ
MKSFRFPLEAVLDARRAQEDEAKLHFAAAMEAHRVALVRCHEAREMLNKILEAMVAATSGRFTIADRDRSLYLQQAQEKLCVELQAAAAEFARVAEEKRAVMLQTRRDRELLERLKATRRQAWQKEADRAEQHLFDEFAMTRRHQAAQKENALC